MPTPESEPKQPTEATSAHAGWLTRARVAAELGYRSIYPIRKMEGTSCTRCARRGDGCSTRPKSQR